MALEIALGQSTRLLGRDRLLKENCARLERVQHLCRRGAKLSRIRFGRSEGDLTCDH
jgi:hypothetical protein